MKRIDLQQGSPEWLKWRLTHRMASWAPAVMGEDPYNTRQNALEFYAGNARPKPQTAAMRRGHEMEPKVREHLNKKYRLAFEPAVVSAGVYGASLDGLHESEDGTRWICEIKSPSSPQSPYLQAIMAGNAGSSFWQIQHQLYVSKAQACCFAVLDPDSGDVLDIRIMPDPKAQENLLKAWDALIDEAASIASRSLGKEIRQAVAEWEEVHDAIKKMQAQEVELRERIVLLSNGVPYLQVGDVRVQYVARKGNVQYKKIPQLAGVDLDQFRTPDVEYFRIEKREQS